MVFYFHLRVVVVIKAADFIVSSSPITSDARGVAAHRRIGGRDQPGQFKNPQGLTLTPDESFLLVVDQGNHRVAVLRATDGTWTVLIVPWYVFFFFSFYFVVIIDILTSCF